MSDDIIVYAKTPDEHDHILERVLTRFSDAGLTLNRDKCKFKVTELVFVGHMLLAGGIDPLRRHAEAVQNACEPKCQGEMRSFLDLTQYVSKFIPN